MSLPIYRVIALKKEEKEREDLEKRDKDEEEEVASPVKSVLASFGTQDNKQEVTKRGLRATEKLLRPTKIEEVPFRRQDQRTLNARYRRRMDKRLILCISGSSLLLLVLGISLLVVHQMYQEGNSHIRPFIVIGPVLIGGGVMTALFSLEVCQRLYVSKKRILDPEVDSLVNPHEVKHWMDPQLIPYGWGLFTEKDEVILVEQEEEEETKEEKIQAGKADSHFKHPILIVTESTDRPLLKHPEEGVPANGSLRQNV